MAVIEKAARAVVRKLFPNYGKPDWKNLALSYDSAREVSDRKSAAMALYLRERRDPTGMRDFHRRRHLRAAIRARSNQS